MTSVDPWQGYTAKQINQHIKERRPTWYAHVSRPSRVHSRAWVSSDLSSPTEEGIEQAISSFLKRHPRSRVNRGPYVRGQG